jgi:hypothetical protein
MELKIKSVEAKAPTPQRRKETTDATVRTQAFRNLIKT